MSASARPALSFTASGFLVTEEKARELGWASYRDSINTSAATVTAAILRRGPED